MTADWQLIVVLVLIAAALGYVLVATLQPWRQRGCASGSGGCGTCATTPSIANPAAARRISLPLTILPPNPRGPR